MKNADPQRRAKMDPLSEADAGGSAPSAGGNAMPTSDPAFPILSGILSVVPASRWNLARVDAGGNLISRYGSLSNGNELATLAAEYDRQRTKVPVGPRIAATLGGLDELASGITLLFADTRAHFGILTLLRSADLGPFTSSEVSMLTFAPDALSDRFSALRLQPHATPNASSSAVSADHDQAFYILDRDLQIVLAWASADERRVALTGLQTRIAQRLPAILENTVREMTTAWADETAPPSSMTLPVAFLVVRTQRMSGPAGLFIGVRIERFVPPNSLTGAAARFHISPREAQVLALLLDGNQLDQIAERLSITSSTV